MIDMVERNRDKKVPNTDSTASVLSPAQEARRQQGLSELAAGKFVPEAQLDSAIQREVDRIRSGPQSS